VTLAAATEKSTGKTADYIASLQSSKRALENTLSAQHDLNPAVQTYIDQLYNIPAVVQTTITANIAQAQANVQTLLRSIASVQGSAQSASASIATEPARAQGDAAAGHPHGGFIQHLASGGMSGLVSGPGSSTSDSIVTALSTGEFVTKASSAAYAPQFMSAYNKNPRAALGAVAAAGAGSAGPVQVSLAGATLKADLRALAAPKMGFFVGAVQSVTATGFTVVISTGVVPAFSGSDYVPAVGESVRVWFINEVAYVMGPLNPNPTQATVVSVASGIATMTAASGATIFAPYASTLSPTAGQIMQLMWANGPFGVAIQSTAPSGGTPPSGGGGNASTHVDTFTALGSGSYQSRWWTTQVYASDTNIGLWFTGRKFRTRCRRPRIFNGCKSTFHQSKSRGLTRTLLSTTILRSRAAHQQSRGSTAIGVVAGWVHLPVSFGQSLRAANGWCGVGVDHGGFSIFNAVAADGQSGALRITSSY
jgi:hypothetical protein